MININQIAELATSPFTYVGGVAGATIYGLVIQIITPMIKRSEVKMINSFFAALKTNSEAQIAKLDPEWQHIAREVAEKLQKDSGKNVSAAVTSIANALEKEAKQQVPVIGEALADVINTAEETIVKNINDPITTVKG